MPDTTFQCPHCGTDYDVKTVPAPYDPNDHSANCDGCGKVMATWFFNIRPTYTKAVKSV